jgi:hypothetical protein
MPHGKMPRTELFARALSAAAAIAVAGMSVFGIVATEFGLGAATYFHPTFLGQVCVGLALLSAFVGIYFVSGWLHRVLLALLGLPTMAEVERDAGAADIRELDAVRQRELDALRKAVFLMGFNPATLASYVADPADGASKAIMFSSMSVDETKLRERGVSDPVSFRRILASLKLQADPDYPTPD